MDYVSSYYDSSSYYTYPARFLKSQTDLAGSEPLLGFQPQQEGPQQEYNDCISPLSPDLHLPAYSDNSLLSSDQPTSASPMRRHDRYREHLKDYMYPRSSLSSVGLERPTPPYTGYTGNFTEPVFADNIFSYYLNSTRDAYASWNHSELEAVSRTVLKRLPQKIGNFKRKAVRIMLNSKETLARPGAGAAKDVMSLSLARSLKIPIQTSPSDKGVFSLGNGKVVESIGRAYVPCSLFGDSKSQESRWFHVLSKLVVPLVMSFEWIEKIGLYTKRKDLLVECPSWFGNMPTLKWLGSPQGRIKFEADGKDLIGCADTGSDLDFISLSCARKRGFAIDRRQKSRSRVMMADGTICSTEGTVHISSIKIADFDSFDMKFHVLDGLPSDVIFGEEFLEQIDAFNTCSGIMDIEDHYLDGLNTLINLGPVQAFFSRKWGSKKVETPKQQSHDVMEEKLYWKNKLTRSYARVVEEDDGVFADIVRGGEDTIELDPVPPSDTGIKREIVDSEVNRKVEKEATAQKVESIECAQRTSAQVVRGRCVCLKR